MCVEVGVVCDYVVLECVEWVCDDFCGWCGVIELDCDVDLCGYEIDVFVGEL